MNVALVWSLFVLAFLIPEEPEVFRCIDCLLISESHWKTHVQSTAIFGVSDWSFNRSKISERIWCHRSFFVVLWEVFRYNFGIRLTRSRVIVENSTIRLFVNFKNGSGYSQTTITSEGVVDIVDVCFRDRRRSRTFIGFFQISSHFEYTMPIFTESWPIMLCKRDVILLLFLFMHMF